VGPRCSPLQGLRERLDHRLAQRASRFHFPTKDARLDTLAEDWLACFEQEIVAGALESGWARPYVRACAHEIGSPRESATDVATLPAVAGDPRRLKSIGRRRADWHERLAASSPDLVEATTATLAADGLFFADLLGLARRLRHAGTIARRKTDITLLT
jgi:hypothetical protein